jgi:hypothetical protein
MAARSRARLRLILGLQARLTQRAAASVLDQLQVEVLDQLGEQGQLD